MAYTAQLKRVEFVKDYAGQGVSLVEKLYKTARGFVPGFVEPYLVQLEDLAINVSAPYVTVAQDTAEKVLQGVDSHADYALNTLASAVGYTQEVHEKNLGTYNGAKEQYFGVVEGAVKYTKQVLDPNPYIKKVESTAKWAGATAAYYVDPDKIVDTGAEYAVWASSFGPVPTLLELGKPVINTGIETYGSLHDSVVSLPLYKKVLDLGYSTTTSLTKTVAETWPVKTGLEIAYPVVGPLTEPVIGNFTKSKYLKQVAQHLAPTHKA
jgi:hypothetical protein